MQGCVMRYEACKGSLTKSLNSRDAGHKDQKIDEVHGAKKLKLYSINESKSGPCPGTERMNKSLLGKRKKAGQSMIAVSRLARGRMNHRENGRREYETGNRAIICLM